MYQALTELIDTRSFSSLWFWIAVIVFWSWTGQRVLGVPWDMVIRARKTGGDAEEDLRDIVRINVVRLLRAAEHSGVWSVALLSFVLSMLLVLGLVYRVELAQAVFLLALPACLIHALALRTARQILAADGDGLHEMLGRHRLMVQGLGFVSLFVTATWGMWQNLSTWP